MLKNTLLAGAAGVLVPLVGLVAAIAMQPSEFRIARSAKMNAPPEEVFAQVNNFHKWEGWSPWLKIDPNAKCTYEGPESGEGAIFRWAGNAEVGEGSMTILESKPNELVRIKLHFLKPFEDTAITELTLKPEGEQTNLTWSMEGRNNFIAKAICLLFMDMEEMIGSKYEEGLAKIKSVVEAPEEATPAESGPKAKEAGAKSVSGRSVGVTLASWPGRRTSGLSKPTWKVSVRAITRSSSRA